MLFSYPTERGVKEIVLQLWRSVNEIQRNRRLIFHHEMFRRDHAEDFFGAGLAAGDFEHRGLAELGHFFFDRLGANLAGGSAVGDEVAHLFADGHHFEYARTRRIAAHVALRAALWSVEHLAFIGAEPRANVVKCVWSVGKI